MIPKRIKDLAFQGDVSAIQGVLLAINDDRWGTHVDIPGIDASPADAAASKSEELTEPRELTEEERLIVQQLSELLVSRLDSLNDIDLLTVIQMPLINVVPFVKRLAEHDNPTALFRYYWMLQGNEEADGVIPDKAEAARYFNRAVDSVCKVSDVNIPTLTSDENDINTYDYQIKGSKTNLKTIEAIITSLCRKKGISEDISDGRDIDIPIGPVMYLLAGGDSKGRYKGIIRNLTWQGDTLVLNAQCIGISSGAFKAAFEIFFGEIQRGDIEIERKETCDKE